MSVEGCLVRIAVLVTRKESKLKCAVPKSKVSASCQPLKAHNHSHAFRIPVRQLTSASFL